jgi:ferric-dicitrate binding protein FerR (iron transport regulator)
MRRHCPQAWKIDAMADGTLSACDGASFERHTRLCRECADRARIERRLRDLVEELPAVTPSDLPLRRLRARILSDAREGATRLSRPWRRTISVTGVVFAVAAVAIALGLRFRPPPSPYEYSLAGSVTAVPGAEWEQSRREKVETVHLSHGELWIVVRKQTPGERFVVATPDGELEVRGTTFDVVVDGGSTRRVHVVEGRVAVWLRDRPVLELAAGESWDRDASQAASSAAFPPPTTPTVPASAMAAAEITASRRQNLRSPAGKPHPSDDGSADYEGAMSLYSGARFAEAAEAFRRFEAQHRSSAFLEDASFLEALSLTKAGHVDAGAVAASRHLAEFPRSFHAKEASILVARAARDRGECDVARRSIAPWQAGTADTTIGDALGACAAPSGGAMRP